MNFLLDTNMVSEWVRPRPDPGVVDWLESADEDRIFISVITLAELRHGIEQLKDGARRKRLDEWLRNELTQRFSGRVLSIDDAVADAWGRLMSRSAKAGRPIQPMDGFIAAIAEVHALVLVTRNVADFNTVLKTIVNPWKQNN
ncbi:MAG: type II toxin-antitoxin system VapC family toxin [Alphaproteobacteria bacterium]